MKHLITILAGAAMMCSCSCSKEAEVAEEAQSRGKLDAEQLSHDAPGLNQIQLERRILEVRNAEATYRKEGHDKAADRYIEDFQSHLREINDSLARVIFDP